MKRMCEVDIAAVTANWERYWSGTLGRPIFHVVVTPEHKAEYTQNYIPSFSRPNEIEQAMTMFELQLDACRYVGDAYPMLWMNFGPGVLAAMTGGTGIPSDDTVWFEPGRFADCTLDEISVLFDPESEWARWLADCYRTANARFHGKVKLGMTDLGGTLDVLSSLRGAQNLLLDLFDAPAAIKRLLREETMAFQQAFRYFDRILREESSGSSCWAGLLSSGSTYMLQSDFSYMISSEMFDEFVRPELAIHCDFLDQGFYHLDGSKQIPHLNSLRKIKRLRGIQWVPGDGNPMQGAYSELLAQIEDLDFKLQLYGSLESVTRGLAVLKDPSRANVRLEIDESEINDVKKLMSQYGLVE